MRHCLPAVRKLPTKLAPAHGILKNMLFFAVLLFTAGFATAQNAPITGRITYGDSALANVTVQVKGTNSATQTDANGNFTIVAAPTHTLLISAVGYKTSEVKVDNRSSINISLESSTQQLEQVVLVGYGTQRRKDLTGSISSVNAATIEKVPVTTVDQALQGRAAGVQVTNNDATPGGNISVLIRGVGSLASGGNAPLYVVDGYPTTGGINNLNPNDIATMDVLKDASATAIYGIRAANGVIIITTKKGQKNNLQVSFDMYESIQGKPKTYDILDAQQFATLANEVAAADRQQNFQVFEPW